VKRLAAALVLSACGGIAVLDANPPECPADEPTLGSSCIIAGLVCSYAQSCGNGSVVCEGGAWTVGTVPQCPGCETYGETDCMDHVECVWMTPGCGDGEPAPTGCFPAEDCTAGSCPSGKTCTVVNYDPCYEAFCQACGAEASICK